MHQEQKCGWMEREISNYRQETKKGSLVSVPYEWDEFGWCMKNRGGLTFLHIINKPNTMLRKWWRKVWKESEYIFSMYTLFYNCKLCGLNIPQVIWSKIYIKFYSQCKPAQKAISYCRYFRLILKRNPSVLRTSQQRMILNLNKRFPTFICQIKQGRKFIFDRGIFYQPTLRQSDNKERSLNLTTDNQIR